MIVLALVVGIGCGALLAIALMADALASARTWRRGYSSSRPVDELRPPYRGELGRQPRNPPPPPRATDRPPPPPPV